jgi:hypothetical protein
MQAVQLLKSRLTRANRFGADGVRVGTAILLSICVTPTHNAFGQTVQADQAELARSQAAVSAPSTVSAIVVDDHIVSSPNDADLGEQQILRWAKGYQPFVASVAVPFYWTSNVALTNRGVQSDFLVSPVAAIAYQPRITTNLYGSLGVREQLFYYDRFSNLNFGSFDVEIGLTYTVPQLHDLVLRAAYDYNRLTEKNSFNDLFSDHVLIFNAQIPFRLSRAQQLSLGATANISLTGDPDPPRRHEFGTYVGYSVQLTRAFSFDASAALVLRDYVLSDRIDLSEILALSATYSLTRFLNASAIASFAGNQSNHSVFDYHVGNVGGAIAISIRF